MTTSQQLPHHMSIDRAIRFRDPFVVSKDISPPSKSCNHTNDHYGATWASQSRYSDFCRALTPPPEMNGTQQALKPAYLQREPGLHYGDNLPSQQAYRAPVAPYVPQDLVNSSYSRHNSTAQASTRASPIQQTAQDVREQRRKSHPNAIAVNFQIPRSVNDSGGSLSELAAQSAEILQQVEDSAISLAPPRLLTPDAKPTTGFRKWVTTVLSTTMVPQNVVILALLFIYRLKKLNPVVKGKPGSEYRLLTVALMLGNKFLDDNTYTNKTWAEVSGINVGEVHIMEVEFLSNMKYNLFTSEDDWSQWQSLLGKFASFFDRATRPQPPAPILPPASSLHLRRPLPSPPASTQASPPHMVDLAQFGPSSAPLVQLGPTPAPSPLGNGLPSSGINQTGSRKRSIDEYSTEPPPKRLAGSFQNYTSPQRYSTMPPQTNQNQGPTVPRLTLPSLPLPTSQATSNGFHHHDSVHKQQLPPLTVPARAMAMIYPSTSSQGQVPHVPASAGSAQYSQPPSQYESRQTSPFGCSAATSPTNAGPQGVSVLHPAHHQVSPTYFLQQRSSPYRPVHNVSTLLYPPSSAAIQSRPPTVELNQMQYQPLGQPVQHTGRLPYERQNVYLNGSQPRDMTPIHAWPGFSNVPKHQQQQQPHMISQQ